MNAIVVRRNEGEPVLSWEEVDTPRPGPGEVLIRVKAAGVNRADLLQARGGYPVPPGASEILGLEVAGIVGELGPEVTSVKVGARVCALLPGGGYAESAAVDHRLLMPLPDS